MERLSHRGDAAFIPHQARAWWSVEACRMLISAALMALEIGIYLIPINARLTVVSVNAVYDDDHLAA